MYKWIVTIACLLTSTAYLPAHAQQATPARAQQARAQQAHAQPATPARPKLVVGIMVDQMRWDFLYRFWHHYETGGFKRLLRDGFRCENTNIDYYPTVTACGHASVYTGSVPAIHGIAGNDWYDRQSGKGVYCTADTSVTTVGSTSAAGAMSPRNLLTTTIGDELRIATNFQSRVVSIALKDRAAILPGGHAASAAFWFDDDSGHFITSSYYMKTLPDWATSFNKENHVDQYLSRNWQTLYPINSYKESTADDKYYEVPDKGAVKPVFIHQLSNFVGKDYGMIKSSPYGNSITFDFAKAAVEGYQLGKEHTDMLNISFSSPDIVGHSYGPNSIEVEDIYLRLDKELATFLSWLDQRYGRNNYLLFLTADHGVVESPGFLRENTLPGGAMKLSLAASLNEKIQTQFGITKAISTDQGAQIYLNRPAIAAAKGEEIAIERFIIRELRNYPHIADAVSVQQGQLSSLPAPFNKMFINGCNTKRSGDIFIITAPGVKNGSIMGTTHGTMYPYDTHIPLLWFGWQVPAGRTYRPIAMTDIAPTLAAFLQIQMPSGNIGQPITEVLTNH